MVVGLTSADGAPLPGWLRFDPATGQLVGTPSPEEVGALELLLTADDGQLSGRATLVIDIAKTGAPALPVQPSGVPLIDASSGDWRWSIAEDRRLGWSFSEGLQDEVFPAPDALIRSFEALLAAVFGFIDVRPEFVGEFDAPALAARAGSTLNLAPSSDPTLVDAEALPAIGFSPAPVQPTDRYPGQPGDLFLWVSDDQTSGNAVPGTATLNALLSALGTVWQRAPGAFELPISSRLPENHRDLRPYATISADDGIAADGWNPATPMLLEVLALQNLYGANPQAHNGDTTHALRASGAAATLWDASGDDTVSARDAESAWTILLPETDAGLLPELRIGVALPSSDLSAQTPPDLRWLVGDFEHATGSSAGDWISGNELANRLAGEAGNDTIDGASGDDRISGGPGNDVLSGGAGDDRIDGGDDFDVARYDGPVSDYLIRRSTQSVVTDALTPGKADGLDILSGVERLEFRDMKVNLTIQATAAQVPRDALERIIELYVGFFGRIPAATGLENWLAEFISGRPILAIAEDFHTIGTSPQLRSMTGYWDSARDQPLSDEDYVEHVYRNVLGRDGRAEGIAYWSAQLKSGEASRGSLVCAMLDSAHALEGDAGWGWVEQLLDDRVAISERITIAWGLDYAATPEGAIRLGVEIANSVIARPNPLHPEIPVQTFDFDSAVLLIGVVDGRIDLGWS
jgi:hypothetical protein